MAVDALAVDFLDVLGEELGDVLVGRPVDRHAQLVAVDFLELGLQLRLLEPVGAEPVEVGELLVGQLVELLVRAGGEGDTDEIVEVQGRRSEVLAFVGHHVADRHRLAVAEVGADQVRVVDPAVVDVLAGLHLRLQLLHHVAFLHQVVGELDPGDLAEGLGQHLGFILVGGDGLRGDIDLHAAERLGRLDEPLQLGELLLLGQGGRRELAVDPLLRRLFVGIGPGRTAQSGQRQQGRQRHAMSGLVIVVEHRLLLA